MSEIIYYFVFPTKLRVNHVRIRDYNRGRILDYSPPPANKQRRLLIPLAGVTDSSQTERSKRFLSCEFTLILRVRVHTRLR